MVLLPQEFLFLLLQQQETAEILCKHQGERLELHCRWGGAGSLLSENFQAML